MKEEEVFKIVKVGQSAPSTKKSKKLTKKRHTSVQGHKTPVFGVLKGGKTARNKPRFEGVGDPAKSPPLRKSSRLRILTEKGAATRRAKIVEDAKKRPIHKIRETLRKHNLNVREHTPEHLTRKIYEDAQEAGMISPT
jgi:hypothetical protein